MWENYSYRDDPDVPSFDDSGPVAVMDAECALCCWSAKMIHRLDKSQTVRICPAQSPLGQALFRHYGLAPEDPESWLFLDGGKAYLNLEAVIFAGRKFGGLGRLVSVLRIFPEPMRDWFYKLVATNRYKIFGRGDLCAIPDAALRKRLLQ